MKTSKNSRNSKFLRAVTTTAVLITGLGVVGYMWWNSNKQSLVDHDASTELSKKSKSKCIVVTQNLLENNNINWMSLLEEDCVLLIAPGLDFQTIKDKDDFNDCKIIHCETMVGLWSCVKHLNKDILMYIPLEIQDGLPIDIDRSISEIIELDGESDISQMG